MKMLNPALVAVLAVALSGCMTKRVQPPPSAAIQEARAHALAAKTSPADRCAQQSRLSTATPVTVPFAYNQAELSETGQDVLREAGAWLACHPATYASIVAQHDNQGTAQAQKALIAAPQATVRAALTAGGVDAARLLSYRPDAGGTLVIDARGRGW